MNEIKSDDPLMPAYLVAKDAHLDNRGLWNEYERTGHDRPPFMPWIAVVQALDKAGMLVRPVAEPESEGSCTCGWGGQHDPDNPRCDLYRPVAEPTTRKLDPEEQHESWEMEGEPDDWWPINAVLVGDIPRGGRFRKRTITLGAYEYIDGEPWTEAEMADLKSRLKSKAAYTERPGEQ